MEIRIILRGALSGFVAGVLGFVFAKIFAEPVIEKAIDYESGRDAALAALNRAAGRPVVADGPEIFSRTIQSTVGVATGLIGFGTAMGALVGVAYLLLHGRVAVRPRQLAWMIAAFGFVGVFLLPFVKYPANPPAIGHDFTITTRGHLYLIMVAASLVLLGAAVVLTRRLMRRYDVLPAILLAALGFAVLYGLLVGFLPSLGDLAANVQHAKQFGFARAATETPQPITNILHRSLVIHGRTVEPGQIVFPGFDADVLWTFRWYALLDQLLIWTASGLIFGDVLERFLGLARPRSRDRRGPVSQSR